MPFFDELSRKITSTTRKASQMAGDASEIARLKLQITAEQDKIRKNYLELGKQYFELHRNDADEALQSLIEDINVSLAVIDAANEAINTHKDNLTVTAEASPAEVITCPKCGASMPSGSKFCTECGEKLVQPETRRVIFCTNCGKALSEDDKFCTDCGTPVHKPE